MPIRGRLRNSGGDPGTQGPAGNRGSRRVCGASGQVGSGQQPGNRQLSDRRAGLCDRARPLHLIHGGASSSFRHLLWRIRALAASVSTPTASRRGAAPPGLRSERRGKAVPQGRPGEPGKYSLWIAMWMRRWTGAGKQGITPQCPVDSQRILRLLAQSPCASRRPGSRNSPPPNADPGETPEAAGSRETGSPAGVRAGGGRAAGRTPGNRRPSNRRALAARAGRGPSISYMEGPSSVPAPQQSSPANGDI
jgi:hypothetical protein